jgi:hypothetical protein
VNLVITTMPATVALASSACASSRSVGLSLALGSVGPANAILGIHIYRTEDRKPGVDENTSVRPNVLLSFCKVLQIVVLYCVTHMCVLQICAMKNPFEFGRGKVTPARSSGIEPILTLAVQVLSERLKSRFGRNREKVSNLLASLPLALFLNPHLNGTTPRINSRLRATI